MTEVAAALSVCTATVYRLIEKGLLPALRVNHLVLRIRVHDFEAFVAGRALRRE